MIGVYTQDFTHATLTTPSVSYFNPFMTDIAKSKIDKFSKVANLVKLKNRKAPQQSTTQQFSNEWWSHFRVLSIESIKVSLRESKGSIAFSCKSSTVFLPRQAFHFLIRPFSDWLLPSFDISHDTVNFELVTEF